MPQLLDLRFELGNGLFEIEKTDGHGSHVDDLQQTRLRAGRRVRKARAFDVESGLVLTGSKEPLMLRRDFVRAATGLAMLAPAPGAFARTLALLATAPTLLPARSLAGSELQLAKSDVEAFAASLRGELLLPGADGYDKARRVWNGAFDKHPALIARCTGNADVVAAVDFARRHELLTAIRGGGHSTSGKSTCDGGLVIDLAAMRGASVDPRARRARVAGGALLGDLDHETRAFGLVTTAGTVSHTGAGGLILGGGFGRVCRHFGLACDNVLAAEVVTAAGELVRASAGENPDLYWALRGGGGNFGVVTAFELELHPMDPTVFGGVMLWPAARAREIMRRYRDFAQHAPDALNADIFLAGDGGPPAIGIELCWSADRAHGTQVIAPLRAIGGTLQDTVAPVPYVAMQTSGDARFHDGTKFYGKAGFLTALEDTTIDALVDGFEAQPPGSVGVFMQMSGGAVGRVGPTDTAFVNRDSRFWLMVNSVWQDPADREGHIASARALWARAEGAVSGFYINTMADEQYARARQVFGVNYERLTAVKGRYDPRNLFRLNANIPPQPTMEASTPGGGP
jgi:FAD/FMN-containing dehydrogenase